MQHNAYEIHGEHHSGRWLITCDHATNHVPDWVNGGDLGLPSADMERHIAFDPGAAGVTRALAEELRSPALLSNFSRLVIDPNRGEDDPTLLMRLYDGTVIPANRNAGPRDRAERLDRLYRPYHAAYAELAGRRDDTVIVAIHSFTPKLRGRAPRPWQIAILYSHRDDRLARPMVDRLREEPDLSVGENEPYSGHLPGDSVDRHALAHGRPNILIELRNDVIATPEAQRHWAQRIAPVMEAVLAGSGL